MMVNVYGALIVANLSYQTIQSFSNLKEEDHIPAVLLRVGVIDIEPDSPLLENAPLLLRLISHRVLVSANGACPRPNFP